MIDKTKINNAINILAVVYAFILPLSRAGIMLCTVLLIVLWIIEGNLREKLYKIIKCRYILALIIFILFSIFSLLWVEDKNIPKAIDYIRKYWYLISIFPLYTSLNKNNILKVLYAFLAGMILSMILSWGIYFQWWQIKEVTKDSLSPFMYHVFYSFFIAFSALLSLNFAIYTKNRSLQIFHIMLFMLFTGILFLGIGRTGQAVLIIGLFILILTNFKHKMKIALGTFVILNLLLVLLYTYNNTFKERVDYIKNDVEQMIQKDDYCNSLGGRVFTWKVSYEIMKTDPILGLGIADHLVYLKKEMREDDKFSKCGFKGMINYFHGQYIEIFSQTGAIGLLLFLTIFYLFMRIKLENKVLNNIKIILGFSFLLVFFVDVPFRKQFTIALFALISAIIINQKSSEVESK